MDTFLIIVAIAVVAFAVLLGWAYLVNLANDTYSPYHSFNIWVWNSFLVERVFISRTLAGFRVSYVLKLFCELKDKEEFRKAHMAEASSQQSLAYDFDLHVLQPFLAEHNRFFHLDWERVPLTDAAGMAPTMICELVEENGTPFIQEVHEKRIKAELAALPPIRSKGCDVRVMDFSLPFLSNEVIEKNFNMLSNEQQQAILETPEFSAYSQQLAAALLKRRLDFFTSGMRRYQADSFIIETEKAGRSVKISWRFPNPLNPGWSLLGFRTAEGFAKDEWSEDSNGVRVVHDNRNGELVEPLKEGVGYFYTFFLKGLNGTGSVAKQDLLRFQMTVDTKAETEFILSALKGFEEKPDPDKENLSRALKELGAYVEMDTAFDAMEKSFVNQIAKADYSEADKQRKIERLQDIVRQIRAKYEP